MFTTYLLLAEVHVFPFMQFLTPTRIAVERANGPDGLDKVDLISHAHVPAVIVQSCAPSENPSDCAGHAAAVSSQRSSVTER